MVKRIDVRIVCVVLILGRMTVQAERGVGLTPEAEFVTLSDIASTPAAATVTEAAVTPALNPDAIPIATVVGGETNINSISSPAVVTAKVEGVKSEPVLTPETNESATVSAPPEIIPVASFDTASDKQNLISVALDDVPLQDVVRLFTKISGANIISSSTNLVGKVTVNLQEVEWKPALDSILDMYNLIVMEKVPGSSIFSVLPKPPGDMLISQTIFLKHSQASNVVSIIDKMIVPTGMVRPCPNVNAMVVRSTVANLNEIRKVVEEIDVPRQQVYIEAKFLELTDEAIKDMGINWKSLAGYEVKVAQISQTLSDSRSKFNGQRTGLGTVESDLRLKGSSTPGVPGSGATDSRSQTDILRNGNSSSLNDSTEDGLVSAVGSTASRDRTDSITKSLNYSHESERIDGQHLTDVRTAVLSASDFSFILSALQQLKGVSVVSNPKIIVANEQTAKIQIGEKEPNITGTVTPGQQGQANSTVYKLDEKEPYFNYGITLNVSPTINNDSNVLVRISPILSRYVRDKIAPDKNTYPVRSAKEVETVFCLESGKTAAIGGLTETEEREEVSKIPLLGDIPLIGKYLFSHTHKKHTQVETIIFVTVRLANAKLIQREEGLPEDTELTQKHFEGRKAKQVAISKKEKAAAKPDKTP